MPDNEKTIQHLEMVKEEIRTSKYDTWFSGSKKVRFIGYVDDAIELLKEQEPKLVRYTTSTVRCPNCNKQITTKRCIHREIKYCWKCGQAVKWE